jgi:tetratricopeptide (TPR) repeat protein
MPSGARHTVNLQDISFAQLAFAWPLRWSLSSRSLFRTAAWLASLVFGSPVIAQEACPNLQPYYPAGDDEWPRVMEQLIVLQPQCLENAEYYLLLGTAELNSGYVEASVEALERALLLEPENSNAAVVYAQALYVDGQLFPALQLNEQILQRADLPAELVTALRQRQELWREQTHRHSFTADVAVGYDDNLNGAPARSDFTLTLSGEILQLTLDEQFRPVKGPYANVRLGGYYQQLGAYRSHELMYGIRNRQSDPSEAELLQADLRYGLAIPLRHYRWDFAASTTNLMYGGNPLFTATDARVRLHRLNERCQPSVEVAAQYQLYHQQAANAGFEFGATGGVECQLDLRDIRFGIEAGPVHNNAVRSARPGSDRLGWVIRASWQQAFAGGSLRAQFNLTNLRDKSGYSPLLEDGARREIYGRQLRVQYLRPLQQNLTLQFNLSHQRQGSNLAPFENRGTAADVGVTLDF